MQSKYVGDVADFGKYGLLRKLTTSPSGKPDLNLGVVWCLYHDPKEHTNDGKHTTYLKRTAKDDKAGYRDCDPLLWEKLRDLVFRDARCVHCVQDAGIFPANTGYHDALLHFPHQNAFQGATRPQAVVACTRAPGHRGSGYCVL